MKKFLLLTTFISLTTIVFAQPGRYFRPVFNDVTRTTKVYGANATILTVFDTTIKQAVPQPLACDIYQPVGDSEKKRPLAIVFHTGNFLPILLNRGLTGTFRDSAVVEICTRLAKMGYVAVSADYRLGWNAEAQTQPLRALGLLQAAYRGIQDARTCVRYFKNNVATTNDYGIDTTKIVLWGNGTGGYISLACAAFDKFSEVTTTTSPPGKFLTDLDGNPATLEPMVIPAYNGDIEGKTFGVAPPTGLPPIPPGDTLCYPNLVNNTSNFQLCVNLGGALADISWLERGDVPMISFHVPNDENAPYEDAVLVVPTTGDLIVQVQGSRVVVDKAVSLGNNNVLINANINDVYTTAAKTSSALTNHPYLEGLYPLVIPKNSFGRAEGSPWDWWEPSAWNTILHPNGGGVLTFHDVALLTNQDMSPAKARRYIDTIIGYYAPRAYAALGLTSSTDEILSNDKVQMTISPNPATDLVYIQTAAEFPVEDVYVYDLNGKYIRGQFGVNSNSFTVDKGQLAEGLYFLKFRFKEGILTQKVVFR